MNQRVSLYCWESALSPVRVTNVGAAPVIGEVTSARPRTMASVIWVVRASIGR
jgi:hypothetical protein